MTHEPECQMQPDKPWISCGCFIARAAYQRGREDEQNEHRVQGEGEARGHDECVDIELMHYDEIMNDRW